MPDPKVGGRTADVSQARAHLEEAEVWDRPLTPWERVPHWRGAVNAIDFPDDSFDAVS